jgi:hypothetical protein
MTPFQELFAKADGKPVWYKGQIIQLVDDWAVPDGQRIRLTFESVNSEWRQGVYLLSDGGFEVEGAETKTAVFWSDAAPDVIELSVKTKRGSFVVKNVWDAGNGVMHSWRGGAAMIVDPTPSGRRYRCNDGQVDDDFDDLVFQIELI